MPTSSKLNVAVIMGGVSQEHEVSLRSGATALAHLQSSRYNKKAVVIQMDGLWRLTDDTNDFQAVEEPLAPVAALARLADWKIDVALLALHGPNGEDGAVQGFFQTAGIPFTGSGVEASALCMNKSLARMAAVSAGLNTPPAYLLPRSEWRGHESRLLMGPLLELGFPLFLKTLHSGSSLGIYHVQGPDQLQGAMTQAFELGEEVLIEKAIQGREITCGVMAWPGGMEVLPPVEIVPRGEGFFDYKTKYDADLVDEICPAKITDIEWKQIKEATLAFCGYVNARGLSRIDFILNREGPWFLELNTIPGFTSESIVLKEARAANLSLYELFDGLVSSCLNSGYPFSSEGNVRWEESVYGL